MVLKRLNIYNLAYVFLKRKCHIVFKKSATNFEEITVMVVEIKAKIRLFQGKIFHCKVINNCKICIKDYKYNIYCNIINVMLITLLGWKREYST